MTMQDEETTITTEKQNTKTDGGNRKMKNNELEIKDKIETLFEKQITTFGNGAKIDCPKKYLGKKAVVIIRAKD